MKKEKEQATPDFIEFMQKSWTYSRLTDVEQQRVTKAIYNAGCFVAGDYWKRFQCLDAVYYAFLLGVGYTATGWREEPDAPKF
jgi:hypothetical protein